jgi:hypothetical protein
VEGGDVEGADGSEGGGGSGAVVAGELGERSGGDVRDLVEVG